MVEILIPLLEVRKPESERRYAKDHKTPLWQRCDYHMLLMTTLEFSLNPKPLL